MKRVLSFLLALVMVAGLLPTAMAAEAGQVRTVAAEEVADVSLPDSEASAGTGSSVREAARTYADEEIVTVIVQLEEPAVLDYYGAQTYSLGGEELSAGQAVSKFLTSDDAQALSAELLAGQEDVLAQIGGLQPAVFARRAAASLEVVAQWTGLINGMAVKVPYGQLEAIRALPGVKRAYVEPTYERPEELPSTGTTEGYSYDMVGVGAAWSQGYTGEGMVAAILDTGLDLEFASYWDDEAGSNVTGIRRTHEAFRDDSFRSEDPELVYDGKDYTVGYLSALKDNGGLNAYTLSNANVEDYYKNRKIPFAFDYAGMVDSYTGEITGGDVNVRPTESSHGTHVAGTVAGYAKTEEGETVFTGVAPDAQLLIMKVFPDGAGAPESAIINALEDALKLKSDVINLSLGSDNGFSEDDTAAAEIYAKVSAAGIVLMTSAGNSAYAGSGSAHDSAYLSGDPDISMMSSPAIYDTNLAVASINSTVKAESTLVWSDGEADHEIAFADPFDVAMKSTFQNMPEGGIEIIPVGGAGTYNDYYEAGFRSYSGYGEQGVTGIALVQRGEISFADKVRNAASFVWDYYAYDPETGSYGHFYERPIKGVIVYDSDPTATELVYMSVSDATITCCFVSGVDGAAMAAAAEAGKPVTLKAVNQLDRVSSWDEAGQMSEFTSWGAGPGLELKPEITAPGGNIWSSILDAGYVGGSGTYDDYTGTYGMMSGTSMAAPHMTALGILVRQYIREQGLAARDGEGLLASQLLVSTAVPQSDGSVFYSPRIQGAGLANVAAAMETPAYITVEDQSVGKLELGDDVNWAGSYDYSFQVENLTNEALTYSARLTVLRPDTDTDSHGHTTMTDRDVLVKEVELDTVSVPAGGTATVSGTIDVSESVEQLRALFPNGTYVEGYISLTDETGANPRIGLPFLAFLGDWTAAPIFDSVLWTDGCTGDENDPDTAGGADPWAGGYTWNPSILGSCIYNETEVVGWYNLGQNIYDATSSDTQTVYHKENLTISPNNDGFLDKIDDVELYQIRDAKMLLVQVRDAETGALYFNEYTTYVPRSVYYSELGTAFPNTMNYFPAWEGTDLEGSPLPSGTRCVYTVTAYGEGDYGEAAYGDLDYLVSDFEGIANGEFEPTFNGHAMDKTGDVIQFPITVDTAAPKLENNAVSIYEEDGRVYLEGTVYDEDGSLASIAVYPIVTRTYNLENMPYADPTFAETGMDRNNPFYTDTIYDGGSKTMTFKADVTEYVHTNESYAGENWSYQFTWTGNVYLTCGDYGANGRTYAIRVQDMTGEGILLSQTSALLHVGDTFELSVIDNTGSEDTLTRTSSNPEVATVDEFGHIVALAPGQTIITVSNGSSSAICVVAVEEYTSEVLDFDLSIEHFDGLKAGMPITVRVTNLQPADVRIENISWLVYEDDEEWAGLVNVYQNSQDALSGQVELNVSYSSELIPAGSGYLDVTINGVSRRMTFTWEDVYTSGSQDDLISAENYGEQTVYVTMGETATLTAKYKQPHSFVPVELYTMEGYQSYSYTNPTEPAVGLILDGPDFAINQSRWEGRLVAEPGYELPQTIKVLTRYTDSGMDGYETEMYYQGTEMPEWSQYGYSYNPETGDVVAYAPYGATNILVIRADGVENESAPGGTASGVTYERPDGTFGPFDWTWTDGVEGTLETFENVNFGSDYNADFRNGAYFTPSEPGVSYITAASKDGQYSVRFAVVCQPVKAETIDLESHNLVMNVGDTQALAVAFDPTPSLDEDKELMLKSFDESVVRINENGELEAVAPGTAYVKVAVKTETTVQTYCLVTVLASGQPEPDPDPTPDPDPIPNPKPVVPTVPAGSGTGSTASFVDVPKTHWAFGAVEYVAANGLFNGVDATHFDPSGEMTRAMLVTVLWRLEGKPAASGSSFSDVAGGQWYSEAVAWAAAQGVVNGIDGSRFSPDGKVTREQIAAILWRLEGKPAVSGSLSAYPDGSQVSEYAREAMVWATQVGLFRGDAQGRLNPRATATRAEVATLIQRYAETLR